jgi:hypothetical protein
MPNMKNRNQTDLFFQYASPLRAGFFVPIKNPPGEPGGKQLKTTFLQIEIFQMVRDIL